jgi:hypothetical protein
LNSKLNLVRILKGSLRNFFRGPGKQMNMLVKKIEIK